MDLAGHKGFSSRVLPRVGIPHKMARTWGKQHPGFLPIRNVRVKNGEYKK
jgi:hypothetical protein